MGYPKLRKMQSKAKEIWDAAVLGHHDCLPGWNGPVHITYHWCGLPRQSCVTTPARGMGLLVTPWRTGPTSGNHRAGSKTRDARGDQEPNPD